MLKIQEKQNNMSHTCGILAKRKSTMGVIFRDKENNLIRDLQRGLVTK
jgi:hypothetical protein